MKCAGLLFDDGVELFALALVRRLAVGEQDFFQRSEFAVQARVLDRGREVEAGAVSDVVGAGGPFDNLWVAEPALVAVGADEVRSNGKKSAKKTGTGSRGHTAASRAARPAPVPARKER